MGIFRCLVLNTTMLMAVLTCFASQAFAENAGDVRQDEFGVTQTYVPAGCFVMGASDEQITQAMRSNPPEWAAKEIKYEQPQHKICLSQAYWIDQTEVTNASFALFVSADAYTERKYWSADGWKWLQGEYFDILPYECIEIIADHPRVCITWYEAEAYAKWRGGRLPSEAEWEYAARGPQSYIYPWGDDWIADNAHVLGLEHPMKVGTLPQGKSWVSAYDMAGNAMEWVADWQTDGYYTNSPLDDPKGAVTGIFKTQKGGWWGSNIFVSRAAYKYYNDPPHYQDHHIGFRIVSD